MAKIKANPMFLGLDLRGGVHFTMQVDMKAAMQKRLNVTPAISVANCAAKNPYRYSTSD